ncbi:MAG: EAL domain-containing protein [Gammaproteobacteria bacterium]
MQVKRWLVVLGTFVVLAMSLLVAADLKREWAQRTEDAFRHLGGLARTLEEHAVRTLHGTDLVLINAVDAIEARADGRSRGVGFNGLLAHSARLMPHVTAIAVLDADGTVVEDSRGNGLTGTDLSEWPCFHDHQVEGGGGTLHIDMPDRPIGGMEGALTLSRRITAPDGSFGGAVVAFVDPTYFTDFYDAVRVGAEGTIVMVRNDGKLLVRAPVGRLLPGVVVAEHPVFRQIQANGRTGVLQTVDPHNQQVDLVAHRSLEAYPVVIAAGAQLEEVQAGFYRHARSSLSALAAITTAIALLIWYLFVHLARHERTSQALSLQKSYFQQLFDGSPEGIVILDNVDRVIDANRAFQQMFQYTVDELRGRTLNESILPEDLLIEGTALSQRVLEAHSVQVETVRRRKDTTLVHVSILGVPVKLHDDQIGVYGIYRDIGERIEAEQVLRESEERHRVVAEQTGQLVYDYDVTSGKVAWSGAVRKITGYSFEEFQHVDVNGWADMIHPDDRELVLRLLDEARENCAPYHAEYRMRRKSGGWVYIDENGLFLRNAEGVVHRMLGSMSDITERKRITSEMAWQATHDPLTGLVNRHEFEERVARLMFNRRGQRHHALLYIDLDQFKVVNDTCGHQAGDQLLRQLTGLVAATVRETDTLARLGGDEFGLLLVDCDPDRALEIAEKLIETINEFRFVWDDKTFTISASIGLVEITHRTDSVAALFSAADSACYAAKDKGRNRVVVYRDSDQEIAARHGEMAWVSRITKALEEDRFVLYRQGIHRVAATDSNREHYELLVRMVDEDGALIPPGSFIPAAERYNLMPALDRWVIREAFRKLDAAADARAVIAINVSGTTLSSEHFVSYVHEQLQEFRIDPSAICYEITETAAIANLQRAREFIDEMHTLGCKISLDDFGSGLSSFAYLKTLKVDYIKIDGAFVKDIVVDKADRAMVGAIIRVGEAMEVRTIAEYVETEEVLVLLRKMGVDFVQGYHLDKPAPWDV